MQTLIMACKHCTARSVLGTDEIVIITTHNVKSEAVWTCSMCQTEHRDKITVQGFYWLVSRGVEHKIITIPGEVAEIAGMLGEPITEDDLIAFGLRLSKIDTPTETLV